MQNKPKHAKHGALFGSKNNGTNHLLHQKTCTVKFPSQYDLFPARTNEATNITGSW